MADSGVRTRYFWLPNCGDTPHMCIMEDIKDSADSLRVMGKIRKRKKDSDKWNEFFSVEFFLTKNNSNYWIEYFFFEKCFRGKTIKQLLLMNISWGLRECQDWSRKR